MKQSMTIAEIRAWGAVCYAALVLERQASEACRFQLLRPDRRLVTDEWAAAGLRLEQAEVHWERVRARAEHWRKILRAMRAAFELHRVWRLAHDRHDEAEPTIEWIELGHDNGWLAKIGGQTVAYCAMNPEPPSRVPVRTRAWRWRVCSSAYEGEAPGPDEAKRMIELAITMITALASGASQPAARQLGFAP